MRLRRSVTTGFVVAAGLIFAVDVWWRSGVGRQRLGKLSLGAHDVTLSLDRGQQHDQRLGWVRDSGS